MKKKMKNIISTLTLILLTSFAIFIPGFIKKNKSHVVDEKISQKTSNSVCKVRNIYYDSLQTAIDNNPDNLVYELIADINEQLNIINRSLTIEGNNFEIYSSVLENSLGIVNIKDSTINLRNVKLSGTGNVCTGIYVTSSNLSLDNVILNGFSTDNEKMPNGAGIYILNEKTRSVMIKIDNCCFKNCSNYSLFVTNKSENKDEIIPIIRLKVSSSSFFNDYSNDNIFIALIGNIVGDITDNSFMSSKLNIDDGLKSYAVYQNTTYNTITYLNNYFSSDYKSIYRQIKT